MTLTTSTLRPGFLVSLKTSTRGNVSYDRVALAADKASNGVVTKWQTTRTIQDPEEYERAGKARASAAQAVRSVCAHSAFGLLCPEVDSDKLEQAIKDARKIVDEFNENAQLTRLAVFVLAGKVMPDDVEAVRAINSEIRELMAEMSGGIETGDVKTIREAAGKVKGIGEMLSTEAQTKVEMAVKAARSTARTIVKEREAKGPDATIEVDKSSVKRINELRAAFLDLDDTEEAATPKAVSAPQLDLRAE